MNAIAFVNGVEAANCIEADTDAGYVICAKLDEAGRLFADGDDVATERLEGVVTVTLEPMAHG